MTSFQQRLQVDYATLQNTSKSAAQRAATIQRLQRLLRPHLPDQRGRALDLGAGQGELVEALLQLGFVEVSGLELSPSQLDQAQRHGCQHVHRGDGLELLRTLPDRCLDLVSCFDVLEHLSLEVCAEWFAQIQRVLRPGGRLIGHVPNGLSPFGGHVYWGDLSHRWCPVPESVQVFCRGCGLGWVGAYDNIGASTGAAGRLRALGWGVLRLVMATISTIETGARGFALPWSRTFLFVAERSCG